MNLIVNTFLHVFVNNGTCNVHCGFQREHILYFIGKVVREIFFIVRYTLISMGTISHEWTALLAIVRQKRCLFSIK